MVLQLLLAKTKEYFVPEFFCYENSNRLIGAAQDKVMDKDNHMGRLLIDIDSLKDKLQDKDDKVVLASLGWDKFQDKIIGLRQAIMAREADILGLQNSLDRVQSQLLLNQGAADGLRQNWEAAQITLEAMKAGLKEEVAQLTTDVARLTAAVAEAQAEVKDAAWDNGSLKGQLAALCAKHRLQSSQSLGQKLCSDN